MVRIAALSVAIAVAALPALASAQERPALLGYRACVSGTIDTLETVDRQNRAVRPAAVVVEQAVRGCEDQLTTATNETVALMSSEDTRRAAELTPVERIEAMKAQFRTLARETYTAQLEAARRKAVPKP